MFAHAQNRTLALDGDTMHYVRFGTGAKTLIMLPGLGDGLTTVKGTALPMALMYRHFAKAYTVYMFSRRNHLAPGATTRDMSHDLCRAMDALSLSQADLVGVSMGGMIAQHFAADHPDRLGRLVLAVTCAGPNEVLERSLDEWTGCAQRGDHTALMDSNVRRIYSDSYYRKNKWMIPLMGRLTRPASYERFLLQAQACRTHDARAALPRLSVPTLVIGGEQDRVLGPEASLELAHAIPGAQLKMYPEWGHGLYEEAKDFNQVVLDFLLSQEAAK